MTFCVHCFDMEKLCFALVLKMDFSIVGKEKKNDVDECVRKCGHWVHIDLIKTYEQRWNLAQKIVGKEIHPMTWDVKASSEIAGPLSTEKWLGTHDFRGPVYPGLLFLWWSIQVIRKQDSLTCHSECVWGSNGSSIIDWSITVFTLSLMCPSLHPSSKLLCEVKTIQEWSQ